MGISQEVQLTLLDITRKPCPIPGLPIAAHTGQKIMNMIDGMITDDGNLKCLSSIIKEVVCSIYEQSLIIVDNGTKVPSPLTEHINGLIRTLDKAESECRKLRSQGWLRRFIYRKRNEIAIRDVTYELIQAEEVMRTEVVSTVGQSVEVIEKKETTLAPSKTTQNTPQTHATGENVRITDNGSDAIHYNTLSTPSSPTTNISAIGSGVRIENAGNHTINRVVNHTSTSSTPRTGATGQNEMKICHDGQGTVIYIGDVRMTPAGPTGSSTTGENANNYQEGMQAVRSALDRVCAGQGGLSIADTGGQYVVKRGELSVFQNGKSTVIRNGRDTQSFSGLPIVRLFE